MKFDRPSKQVAAWLDQPGPTSTLTVRDDVGVPEPRSGEVLVRLTCSGVCHSDVHNVRGTAPMFTNIPGHEGVGDVVQLGPDVDRELLGKTVGVRWQYSTCGECEICNVDPTACPNQKNTGKDVRGTFATFIVAPAAHVVLVPETLSPQTAAPLLCAGLTIFSAISKGSLRKDDWIVIPGAGGGLGHLGVQIAKELGYRVVAIDTGLEKKELCLNLGATRFIDFETEDVESKVKAITGGYGAQAVVVTAGSQAAYKSAVSLLRNCGTLVCIGLPHSVFDIPLTPFEAIARSLRVVGSSVGSTSELDELFKMTIKGAVLPQIETYPLASVNTVIDKLSRSQINGRAVLVMSST